MLLRHGPQIMTLRITRISIYQTLILYIKKEKLAKRSGILIYVKNHIKFKTIKDLSVSDGDSECVTVEIENKNSKYLIVTLCYRPPSGVIIGLNSFLENVFKKANTENKLCFVAGDFNLNCFDYNKNLETRMFYNRIFAHGCIPLITKPIRVTCKTVSLIDNIFTNFCFCHFIETIKGNN